MKGIFDMMYRFMTLDDKTEINHSECDKEGNVRVYVEKPVFQGFKSAECSIPSFEWKMNDGFSDEELGKLNEYIRSIADIIMDLAKAGGFDNAAGV